MVRVRNHILFGGISLRGQRTKRSRRAGPVRSPAPPDSLVDDALEAVFDLDVHPAHAQGRMRQRHVLLGMREHPLHGHQGIMVSGDETTCHSAREPMMLVGSTA